MLCSLERLVLVVCYDRKYRIGRPTLLFPWSYGGSSISVPGSVRGTHDQANRRVVFLSMIGQVRYNIPQYEHAGLPPRSQFVSFV